MMTSYYAAESAVVLQHGHWSICGVVTVHHLLMVKEVMTITNIIVVWWLLMNIVCAEA